MCNSTIGFGSIKSYSYSYSYIVQLVEHLSISLQPPIQVFGIEGRYAHAMYSAAAKEKSLEKVEKELVQVDELIKSNEKLSEYLANPTLDKMKKQCMLLRAFFKWLSKVISWLRLLRLMIGLKDSRQFFSQWEAKPKPIPIAPCTRDFSGALSKFQIIARNCNWFIALFAPAVIGRSNYFGFGFSTVIWKPL